MEVTSCMRGETKLNGDNEGARTGRAQRSCSVTAHCVLVEAPGRAPQSALLQQQAWENPNQQGGELRAPCLLRGTPSTGSAPGAVCTLAEHSGHDIPRGYRLQHHQLTHKHWGRGGKTSSKRCRQGPRGGDVRGGRASLLNEPGSD